jgi:excinuclease UvrABC helicase subunit UvrB
MFGFPLLRALSVVPLQSISLEELMESYFGKQEEANLTDAKHLDTHTYVSGDIQYTQNVYRLKNGSLYTHTTNDSIDSKEALEKRLKELVAEQKYEEAAVLRDKIKRLN